MSRKKREIQIITYVPSEGNYDVFQNRTDEAYIDSLRFVLKQMKFNRDEKLKVIDGFLKK